MPATAPVYIKGYEKVVAALGFWPSFHDAPARLSRIGEDRIDLELKPYRVGKNPEPGDPWRIILQHRIVFSFTEIVSVDVHAFGADNIIDALTFSSPEDTAKNGSFIADLDSAMGCGMGGHLRAKSGEITLIEEIINLTTA